MGRYAAATRHSAKMNGPDNIIEHDDRWLFIYFQNEPTHFMRGIWGFSIRKMRNSQKQRLFRQVGYFTYRFSSTQWRINALIGLLIAELISSSCFQIGTEKGLKKRKLWHQKIITSLKGKKGENALLKIFKLKEKISKTRLELKMEYKIHPAI